MANKVYYKPTFDNIPDEKRRKILDVAVNEFANHGFDNANINTIAKKAEVSVGSLYKYFDTKADLFLTSVNYGVANLATIIDSIASSNDDVMLKLEKLICIAIDYSRRYDVLIKLYNQVTGESDRFLAEKIAADMEGITSEAYKKAIVEGQQSGDIRKDIDPGMAAFLIDSLLMNIQFSYACNYYSKRYKIYAGDDIFERDEFALQNILKFVKAALESKE